MIVLTCLLLIVQCLTLQVPSAQVSRVLDGDTFGLYAVGVPAEERVRVLGVDAAEIRDSLGPAARAYTVEWLSRGPFMLAACKRDSFGRLLGVVSRGVDTLAVDLIAAKLGVAR